jgi:hypothetical protein
LIDELESEESFDYIIFFLLLESTSSIVITFNSSSFIDYRHREILDYPLRLSVRFRTLGRISNGVLLSLTYRKSLTSITPFIIIEHTNGKVEITVLQLDERNALSTVTVSRHVVVFFLMSTLSVIMLISTFFDNCFFLWEGKCCELCAHMPF